MSNSRKILLAVLLVLTIGLGGLSFYVVNRIQQDQAPTDTNAAGFGASADPSFFAHITNNFQKANCNMFLTKTSLGENFFAIPDAYQKLILGEIKITDAGVSGNTAKNCQYSMGDKKVTIQVFTYGPDAKIDNSQRDLINRLNEKELTKVIKQGTDPVFPVSYSYGTAKADSKKCVTTIYHVVNDFEYAKLTYENFGDCESNDNIKFNEVLFKDISNQIISILVGNY